MSYCDRKSKLSVYIIVLIRRIWGHKMKKEINKLVRDQIPEIIGKDNKVYDFYTLNYDDFLYQLKCKLVEEENEVLCAKDHENLVEELADLLEVVECLLETTDISLSLVKQKQALKKEEVFLKGYI